MSRRSQSSAAALELTGVSAATLVAAAFMLSNLPWPFYDGAIFAVIGEGLARGELPYRDLWDHKPPVVYVISAVAALLPGQTWAALWGISVVSVTATGLLLRQFAGWPIAVLAVASMAMFPASNGGGQTETFAAPFAAASVVLAQRGRSTLSGVLMALACLTSLQAIPAAASLVILNGRRRYLAGALATAVLACAALALGGVLPAAFDALFTHSRAYLRSSPARDLGIFIPLVVAPLSTVVALRFPKSLTRLEVVAAVWFVLGILLILIQGRHLGHYATLLVIPATLLAASATFPMVATGYAVLALCVWFSSVIVPVPQRGPASVRIAEYVAQVTRPDDSILVWGADSNVYLAAERPVAGRYPYLMPLVTHGYTTTAMVDEWVQTLAANPPAVIVDSEAANPYWPDDEDFLRAPPPGAAGGRDLDLMSPFRAWVAEQYRFELEIDGRKIYVLRGSSDLSAGG